MMRVRNSERGARSDGRSAYTLLEVLLTLAIAGIIVAAVASAIQIHYRVVDAGRAEVEQAQLARVLLRRIADDLRAAVPPGDDSAMSGFESLSSSAAATATAAGANAGSASAGAAAAAAATDAAAESTSSDESSTSSSFLGTQYELQLDVSRLPVVHQFAAATSDAALTGALNPASSLSDMKTVSYYLGARGASTPVVDPAAIVGPTPDAAGGGLIRCELSRAAAVFASTQGGLDTAQYEQLLAAEAVALEFHYYDGAQWLMEWDVSTSGALPACVEILLTLRSAAPGVASDPLSLFAAQGDVLEKTYRLVVPLAAAQATAGEATSAETGVSP